MIAYYCCCGTMNCTCGATGCPEACGTGTMYIEVDSGISIVKRKETPKPKTPNIDLSFLFINSEPPHVQSLCIPLPTKQMFSKSGYLPKRIRRKRKSA